MVDRRTIRRFRLCGSAFQIWFGVWGLAAIRLGPILDPSLETRIQAK
jgi:hypothetical protein